MDQAMANENNCRQMCWEMDESILQTHVSSLTMPAVTAGEELAGVQDEIDR